MPRVKKPAVRVGRRPSTSAAEISAVGIDLFAAKGFDQTSVDEIAEAANIARRTFFRYFPSKNAVPWGDFDVHLAQMRAGLEALPAELTIAEGLRRVLLEFNTFPDEESDTHRQRMSLILGAPSLQAYSMLMYTGWRHAVAVYVASKLKCGPADHLPQTVAWMLLGVALSAYEHWLSDDSLDLQRLLAEGADSLQSGLGGLGR
ncbi:mycofactocin system transcriptional regulator [Tomitella biformata]|uniref:mycofactocin system transcriptional regulator n=1 Tax=Tomitella biformata TaxID=630403 RepID=UPI0004658AAD|nr:mycofactocin system transcriptional regulator [Tomitella biformata]